MMMMTKTTTTTRHKIKKRLSPHAMALFLGVLLVSVLGMTLMMGEHQGPSSSSSYKRFEQILLQENANDLEECLSQRRHRRRDDTTPDATRGDIATTLRGHDNDDDPNNNNKAAENNQTLHILYGGVGNETGFIMELASSLKSILLNAPLDVPMEIHFLLDTSAQEAVKQVVLEEQMLMMKQNVNEPGEHGELHQQQSSFSFSSAPWITRQPIHIHTYNVDGFQENWTLQVEQTFAHYPQEKKRFRHSLGAYFRLFAHHVLPPRVEHTLYLDSDVLILAGLDVMWQHVQEQKDQQHLFQWGSKQCSGFSTINVAELPTLWRIVHNAKEIRAPPKTVRKTLKLDDQYLLRIVQKQAAHRVGVLPKEWDVSAADGDWRASSVSGKHMATRYRPDGVGMLHYNGGGASSKNAFSYHKFAQRNRTDLASTWGLSNYYADLPWNWARFLVQSRVQPGTNGHSVKISHHL